MLDRQLIVAQYGLRVYVTVGNVISGCMCFSSSLLCMCSANDLNPFSAVSIVEVKTISVHRHYHSKQRVWSVPRPESLQFSAPLRSTYASTRPLSINSAISYVPSLYLALSPCRATYLYREGKVLILNRRFWLDQHTRPQQTRGLT